MSGVLIVAIGAAVVVLVVLALTAGMLAAVRSAATSVEVLAERLRVIEDHTTELRQQLEAVDGELQQVAGALSEDRDRVGDAVPTTLQDGARS